MNKGWKKQLSVPKEIVPSKLAECLKTHSLAEAEPKYVPLKNTREQIFTQCNKVNAIPYYNLCTQVECLTFSNNTLDRQSQDHLSNFIMQCNNTFIRHPIVDCSSTTLDLPSWLELAMIRFGFCVPSADDMELL